MGVGRRRVISISKIKNINLTEKKWIENLIRGFEKGSNPHSKGEDFSRSRALWILIKGIIMRTILKIVKINKIKVRVMKIILSWDFLVGS